MVLARYFDLISLSFVVQVIVFKVCFLKTLQLILYYTWLLCWIYLYKPQYDPANGTQFAKLLSHMAGSIHSWRFIHPQAVTWSASWAGTWNWFLCFPYLSCCPVGGQTLKIWLEYIFFLLGNSDNSSDYHDKECFTNVNLLLFIGVWLRISGCCPTSREEIEPCIKKSTRWREWKRRDSNVWWGCEQVGWNLWELPASSKPPNYSKLCIYKIWLG